jgi:hypothetical protein
MVHDFRIADQARAACHDFDSLKDFLQERSSSVVDRGDRKLLRPHDFVLHRLDPGAERAKRAHLGAARAHAMHIPHDDSVA